MDVNRCNSELRVPVALLTLRETFLERKYIVRYWSSKLEVTPNRGSLKEALDDPT